MIKTITRHILMLLYGILQTNNIIERKKDKVYAKCITTDGTIYYVQFKPKNDFNKRTENLYVSFNHLSSSTINKGIIDENFGPLSSLESYCEYMIRSNNLQSKSKRIPPLLELDHDVTIQKEIITIDSSVTRDFDDAFSFHDNLLTIYISNVPLSYELYSLNLQDIQRFSSIYLVDKHRPMIPFQLSTDTLSLIEGKKRLVFCMHYNINTKQVSFSNEVIKVTKNYVYESEELFNNEMYQNCYKSLTDTLCEVYDSHTFIQHLMLLMNTECAKVLKRHDKGIFKHVMQQEVKSNENKFLHEFLQYYKNTVGEYTYESKGHDLIGVSEYVHITSPIRRRVDIYNMIMIQEIYSLPTYKEMISIDLNSVNEEMKTIRKVQNKVQILSHYWSKYPEYTDNVIAYVIDIDKVVLKDTKYVATLKHNLPLYSELLVNVYFFCENKIELKVTLV